MRILIVALALLAAACAAPRPEVAAPLPEAPGAWTAFTPAPTEIDGELLTAGCSEAPGASPAFQFWARRGASNRLVVFFDGGGACWDDATCSAPGLATSGENDNWFYKAELLPGDNPAELEGIFDLDNPDNPVGDWSFVFVPYCTGDVHSGANTASYTNLATGEALTIRHRGADNFRLVLEWMRANFDRPEVIFVTGSSAGAYGAATHFGRIREAFPRGRAIMLGDAGQGVTMPGFLTQRNENWRYDLPEAVFGEDAALTDDEDIVARLAAHYPQDRFAQYTTAHDRTQVGFFALMGAGQPCSAWTEQMSHALTARRTAANFRAYLAAGETHTILRAPLFYTEQSAGPPFADWLAAMLSDEGAGWDNLSCAECLAPPARCPFGN